MNPALTLTLAAASLVATSLPAAAQLPYMPPPRYNAPPQRYPPPPPPVTSDWARVRAIAPRSPVRVTAVGLGDQEHQYFVSASDRTLTLLVLGTLPRSARPLLLTLAGSHPELFMAPSQWMEFTDRKVRVNPGGVFVGTRRVADLGEIAKTIDMGDVAEVSADVIVERPPRDVEPSAVSIGAFFAALYGTMAICKDKCGAAALVPILGVPIAAGIFDARRTEHAMRVVYRVR
jgi:hypothetical protein